MRRLLLLRPEDGEPLRVGADAVEGLAGSDVQGPAVLPAEDAVGGRLRGGEEGQLLALGAEDVDAAGLALPGGGEDPALRVDAHAVDAAVLAEVVQLLAGAERAIL